MTMMLIGIQVKSGYDAAPTCGASCGTALYDFPSSGGIAVHSFEIPQSLYPIVYMSPVWLVHLAAIVLAIVFWKRAKMASLLTILGAVLSVTNSIGFLLMQSFLAQSAQATGRSAMEMGRAFGALGMINTCVTSIALGLYVAAVFAGRRYPPVEPD
jgi:hypothetical protein